MRKSSFTGWNISERKLGKEKDILPLLMEKKNGKGYFKKEVILPGGILRPIFTRCQLKQFFKVEFYLEIRNPVI